MERKLFILLTRFPGLDARAMMCYTRFPYSHASVGLEEDMDTFYSFVNKGFIEEKLTRYCRPGRTPFPCALYEVKVSQEIYDRAKALLQSFVERKASLRYSTLGLYLSLIHIPARWKDRYFCSQFVAEILQRCKAAKLKKSSTLYLPKDLNKLREATMVFQGDLLRLTHRYPPLTTR